MSKDSIKKKADQTKKTTKQVFANVEEFAQALALTTTVGFGFWALNELEDQLSTISYRFVQAALVVIGVRAAYEVVKYFNKK